MLKNKIDYKNENEKKKRIMSSAEIQIVNPTNLCKIENFLNNSSYRETIEISANFNTRLSIERRLRLPFVDPQTNVAQNHSNLYMNRRQRMPGFREGQLYTYPINRWRKARRQYLTKMLSHSYTRFTADRPFQALKKEPAATLITSTESNTIDSTDLNGTFLDESSSLGAAGGDTSDSKDSQTQSQQTKEDLPKEWFYDEIELNELNELEDPKSPPDDEYDYDPRYGNKKRRKRRPKQSRQINSIPIDGSGPSAGPVRKGRPPGTPSGRGRGRGRRRGGCASSESTRNKESRTMSPLITHDTEAEPLSFEAALLLSNNGNNSNDSELTYQKYL